MITVCVVVAALAAPVGFLGYFLATWTAERFVPRVRAAVFRHVRDLPRTSRRPASYSRPSSRSPRAASPEPLGNAVLTQAYYRDLTSATPTPPAHPSSGTTEFTALPDGYDTLIAPGADGRRHADAAPVRP
ncbi:hypothetical protein [Streptomyces sp. NPDC001153]